MPRGALWEPPKADYTFRQGDSHMCVEVGAVKRFLMPLQYANYIQFVGESQAMYGQIAGILVAMALCCACIF